MEFSVELWLYSFQSSNSEKGNEMKISSFIKYRLKYNPVIRAISKPYMKAKGRQILNEYARTEYSKKVEAYKDKYINERCFVIGNGPSLLTDDVDKLKNEYTFAANRIYEIFDETNWRPTFYVATDGNFISENYEKIILYKLNQCFLEYKGIRRRSVPDNIVGICRSADFAINRWNDKTIHVSEDLSKCFSDGYTVTFAAIQLAIHMGFKEIYLVGVDFNYSVVRDRRGKIHTDNSVQDYFNGKHYDSTFQNYSSTLRAYLVAKKYCDEHGIIIKNATRGGKLEVFPRVDFDSLFPSQNI